MFEWFKHRQETSIPSANLENKPIVPTVPLTPRPDVVQVLPKIFRNTFNERSWSAKVVNGFCEGCSSPHELLVINHSNVLMSCESAKCKNKLAKISVLD